MKKSFIIFTCLLAIVTSACKYNSVESSEPDPSRSEKIDYAIVGRVGGNIAPGFVKIQDKNVSSAGHVSGVTYTSDNLPDMNKVQFHGIKVADSTLAAINLTLSHIPQQLFEEKSKFVGSSTLKNPDFSNLYLEISIDGKKSEWVIYNTPDYLKDFITDLTPVEKYMYQ